MKIISLIAAIAALSGCSHVPNGSASSAIVEFGIPSVWNIKKEVSGVKVTNATIKADDTTTQVDILLFRWKSSAKDVILSNPK